MASKNTLPDFYEAVAAEYDAEVQKVEYQAPNWLKRTYLSLSDAPQTHLDLGCGTGLVAEVLNSLGNQAKRTGVDFSQAMLDQALQKGLYETLIQQDLDQGLGVDDSCRFDLITGFGLFDDVYPTSQLFEHCKKVLAPRGEVWFSVQKKLENAPYPIENPEEWVKAFAGEYQFEPDEIKKILSDAGLSTFSLQEEWGYTLDPQMMADYMYQSGQEV